MKIINKYVISLYDKDNNLLKSKDALGSSEMEVIESTWKEDWWYNEGVGYNHKKMNYPLTFKAKLNNK